MEKLRLMALIVTVFSLFGCDRQYKIGKIIPGHTNIKTAIQLLNSPIESKESTFKKEATFYKWKDINLVVENEIVTSVHRRPSSHEQYLQFWRQHYKEHNSILKKLDSQNLWQFTIENKNISVIYDENSDRVTKVIYYAAK